MRRWEASRRGVGGEKGENIVSFPGEGFPGGRQRAGELTVKYPRRQWVPPKKSLPELAAEA